MLLYLHPVHKLCAPQSQARLAFYMNFSFSFSFPPFFSPLNYGNVCLKYGIVRIIYE